VEILYFETTTYKNINETLSHFERVWNLLIDSENRQSNELALLCLLVYAGPREEIDTLLMSIKIPHCNHSFKCIFSTPRHGLPLNIKE
jgi:hypothetical protein